MIQPIHRRLSRRFALLVLLFSVMLSHTAQAVYFNVSSFTDLNSAIGDFNALTNGAHTIAINADFSYAPTTALTNINNPNAGTSLTILGQNHTLDHAGGIFYSFIINAGNKADVMIEDLALDHFGTYSGMSFQHNSQTLLTLRRTKFTNCRAHDGGALKIAAGATVEIVDSSFSNNAANNDGGAIFNEGTLNITRSTFDENQGNNSGRGGAIANLGGQLTIRTSTITANHAQDGGGVYSGGAVTSIYNSTVSSNTVFTGGFGWDYWSEGATTNLFSTLMVHCSENSFAPGTSTNDLGYNLFESNNSTCGVQNGINHSIVGVDAKLGPLQDNGGLTKTMALDPTSPAINKGSITSSQTDQRGIPRNANPVDIGAFELVIAEDKYEENDTQGSATPVQPSITERGLSIDEVTAGDEDWFQFDLKKGKKVTIDLLFRDSVGDIDMRLYSQTQGEVANSLSPTDNEHLAHTADADDTYTLKVYGFGGAKNFYDLLIQLPDMMCFPVKTQNNKVAIICL